MARFPDSPPRWKHDGAMDVQMTAKRITFGVNVPLVGRPILKRKNAYQALVISMSLSAFLLLAYYVFIIIEPIVRAEFQYSKRTHARLSAIPLNMLKFKAESASVIMSIERYKDAHGSYPDDASVFVILLSQDELSSPSFGMREWKFRSQGTGYELSVPDVDSESGYPCFLYRSEDSYWGYDG